MVNLPKVPTSSMKYLHNNVQPHLVESERKV